MSPMLGAATPCWVSASGCFPSSAAALFSSGSSSVLSCSPYQHCAQLPAHFICPLLVIVNFLRTGNLCLAQVELQLWGTPEKPRHRSRVRWCRLLWPFLSPVFVFRLPLHYYIMQLKSFCYNFVVLAVICLSALLCKRFTWKFMYSHKLSIHSALSKARLGLPATLEQYRERLSRLTCHKLSINSATYAPFFFFYLSWHAFPRSPS